MKLRSVRSRRVCIELTSYNIIRAQNHNNGLTNTVYARWKINLRCDGGDVMSKVLINVFAPSD